MSRTSNAIISIKPHYAEAILAHRKTVELRRRIPETPRGTRLWIYATKPVAAIIGTAAVAEISRGAPSDIWDAYGSDAHITPQAFQAYFEGTDQAIAMVLEDIRRLPNIGIDQLRRLLNGFHPPQVLARISENQATSLEQWASAA